MVGVTTVGGGVSAVDGFFSGILTAVGNASFSVVYQLVGTITYEDVTNIDAVGIITAKCQTFLLVLASHSVQMEIYSLLVL